MSLGTPLLRDVPKVTDPKVLRFLMLQTHYRSPLDFSDERLAEAGAALCRIENAVKNLDWQLQNAQDIPSPLDTRELMKRTRGEAGVHPGHGRRLQHLQGAGRGVRLRGRGERAETADRTISLSDAARARCPRRRGAHGRVRHRRGGRIRPRAPQEVPPEVVGLAADIAGYEGAGRRGRGRLLAARADARAAKDWAVPTPSATACAVWASWSRTPRRVRATYEGRQRYPEWNILGALAPLAALRRRARSLSLCAAKSSTLAGEGQPFRVNCA